MVRVPAGNDGAHEEPVELLDRQGTPVCVDVPARHVGEAQRHGGASGHLHGEPPRGVAGLVAPTRPGRCYLRGS